MKSLQQYMVEGKNTMDSWNLLKIERNLTIDYEDGVEPEGETLRIVLSPTVRLTDKPDLTRSEIVRKGFHINIYLDMTGEFNEDVGGRMVSDYKLQVRFTDKKHTFDALNELDNLTIDGMRDRIISHIFNHLYDLSMRNRFFWNKVTKDKIQKEFKSIFK